MADTAEQDRAEDTSREDPAQQLQAPPKPAVATPANGPDVGAGNLRRMLDVPLDMAVELGRTNMPLSDVLRLRSGSVVSINRLPGEPIDLFINGRLFARGEVVVVNDTFGFRITEMVEQVAGEAALAGAEASS